MTRILFVGDVVGEAGLRLLEARIPAIIQQHQPDFLVANAENLEITHAPASMGNCGMSPEGLGRLWALGFDLVTGGNHSWDGPHGHTIHDDRRVLRPINYGGHAPGRGAGIVNKNQVRLGVINATDRAALPYADTALEAIEGQLAAWMGEVDCILVDFHGDSVFEKMGTAFALDGQVTALVGTHTHVPTLDTRVLPGGTAYVSDVGMTGPSGGMQGYDPTGMVASLRLRLPTTLPFQFATGAAELGAVIITCEGRQATTIERIL
jgi:metallophosphoesterase (TIGR00282 family)